MKQIAMILLIIGLVSGIQPKKFEVIYTVKYNAITLERASDLEKMFRELYKDACNVDVIVKEVIPVDLVHFWTYSDSVAVDTLMWVQDFKPTLIFE